MTRIFVVALVSSLIVLIGLIFLAHSACLEKAELAAKVEIYLSEWYK